MKIFIEMTVNIPAGLTEDEVKARWTRNKVTDRIVHVVEDGSVGRVTKISVNRGYPASIEREAHARG